jgi:YesN/AraC family two-component response regulator
MRSIHAPIRQYLNGEEHVLQAYYGDSPKEDRILNQKECQKDFWEMGTEKYPVFIDREYPILYALVASESYTFIVGPVNVDRTLCSDRNISFCEYERFCEEVLLLFNFLTENQMSYTELNTYNYMSQEKMEQMEKEASSLLFHYHEHARVHNPYDREVREMKGIRDGDVDSLIQSIDEVFQGEYAVLSTNTLQAAKNLGIVGLAISARAAIVGGIPSEEAFSLNDSLILGVDKATSIGEIENIVRYGKIRYAKMVNALSEKKQENVIVEQCKNLIFQRLHSKIVVGELAEELHVSMVYLSALFRKTEQITISEYILREKIKLARNLLIYSEYTIEKIGLYLGFSSQSHFGKVFKKYTGMTPNRFRQKNAKKDFLNH